MAYMKSLTVSGQTYQVKDPEAVRFIQGQALTPAQQANARENLGVLSAKEVLDKFCPSFCESGTVVTCEPVEGQLLEVAGNQPVSNPNLIPVDLSVKSNWEYDEEAGLYSHTIGYVPSGTYTIYADPELFITVYDVDGDDLYFDVHGEPVTFTHQGGTLHMHENNGLYGFVKLEAGTQYTGTNYTKPTLTHTGKNVFGGSALVDELKRRDKGGVTVNEVEKTVTFDPGGMTRGIIFSKFKENTQYTIILYGHNTLGIIETNMTVKYKDGTQGYLRFKEVTENHYVILKTDNAKTVSSIATLWANGKTVLCYDQCGVFEGDVSLEEFEAYRAETLSLGEPIPAFPGVNTLWADTGDITVKGYADPVAIMHKLTNAVRSLGGSV